MTDQFPVEDIPPMSPEEKAAEIDELEAAEAAEAAEAEGDGEDLEGGDELPEGMYELGTRTPEDDDRTNREMLLDAEEIAQIAHAAVVVYREMAGLDPEPSWGELSEEDQLYRRILVLKDIMPGASNPDSHSFSGMLHDAWLAQKLRDSWTWGPSRDEEARTDPRILPYTHLTKAEQWVWVVFRDVCRAFARGGVYSNS